MSEIPQVIQPFRIDLRTNDIITVEQDSDEDIMQCVENICSYVIGTREERPDFGISDQTFQERGIDIALLQKEVSTLEPRANLILETDSDWIALVERVSIRLNESEGGNGE